MSAFLATSLAPQIDIYILRRDFFDGVSFLLQDSDGTPYDLNDVQVCASIWKNTASGVAEQVTSLNIEEVEPARSGRIRLWLSSSQTAAVWDAAQSSINTQVSRAFFPNAYMAENIQSVNSASSLFWDIRIERIEKVADLVSASTGVFITQTNHTLGSSERVTFSGTTQASINYNGTSARIYTSLSGITYIPPYSFSIASLSGITDAAIGGSVYRLKQDTVAAGNVYVGATYSNCFP